MPDTLRLAGALVAPHSHQESDLLDGDLYARLAAPETVAALWGFPAAGIKIGQEALSSPAAGVLAVGGDLRVGGSIRLGDGPLLSPGGSGDDLFLTGDLDVSGCAAVGNSASLGIGGGIALVVQHSFSGASGGVAVDARAVYAGVYSYQYLYGLQGEARWQGSGGSAYVSGLSFNVWDDPAAGSIAAFTGVRVGLYSSAGGAPITVARGVQVYPGFSGPVPATFYGVHVQAGVATSFSTCYGVRVEDFAGTTIRLLEVGGATPYLRVVGGASPGANQTNLYLREQTTLRQVQWKAGNALGAGDKVLVLV